MSVVRKLTHSVDLLAGGTGDNAQHEDDELAGHHRDGLRPESDTGLYYERDTGLEVCLRTLTAYRAISGWFTNMGYRVRTTISSKTYGNSLYISVWLHSTIS